MEEMRNEYLMEAEYNRMCADLTCTNSEEEIPFEEAEAWEWF